jgi:hypothetical protein
MSAVPVPRPTVERRPQLRVVSYRRPSFWQVAAARTALFAFVALGAFLCSSLAGHVMMEKARRDGLRAVDRSREAKKAESLLLQRVESLTSFAAIQEWALAHDFRPPEEAAPTVEERTLVASNR